MKQTQNYELKQPDMNDFVSPEPFNDNAAVIDQALKTQQDAINQMLSKVYPVGAIYMSVDSENPGIRFGGTWAAWGNGRVPVGVNAGDADFQTVERTGGSKALHQHSHGHSLSAASNSASHGHSIPASSHSHSSLTSNNIPSGAVLRLSSSDYAMSTTGGNLRVAVASSGNNNNQISTSDTSHGHEVPAADASHGHSLSGSISDAGTGLAGNLQPYITCFMWKRTA